VEFVGGIIFLSLFPISHLGFCFPPHELASLGIVVRSITAIAGFDMVIENDALLAHRRI
jgi:hypothetical protein